MTALPSAVVQKEVEDSIQKKKRTLDDAAAANADIDIGVNEFLEFEFQFELARYLNCKIHEVNEYKQSNFLEFRCAVREVIKEVTVECKNHMLDLLHRRQLAARTRLKKD